MKPTFKVFFHLMLAFCLYACGGTVTNTGVPTGVTVAPIGPTTVAVSWTPVSGATSYAVYWANQTTGAGPNINLNSGGFDGQVSSTSTSATITGLMASTNYYFVVTSVSSSGQSSASSVVMATTSPMMVIPSTPTAGASGGIVNLAWTTPATGGTTGVTGGLTAFMVFFSTGTNMGTSGTPCAPSSYVAVGAPYCLNFNNLTPGDKTSPIYLPPTTTSTTINGLASGSKYYFTVVALGESISSSISAP